MPSGASQPVGSLTLGVFRLDPERKITCFTKNADKTSGDRNSMFFAVAISVTPSPCQRASRRPISNKLVETNPQYTRNLPRVWFPKSYRPKPGKLGDRVESRRAEIAEVSERGQPPRERKGHSLAHVGLHVAPLDQILHVSHPAVGHLSRTPSTALHHRPTVLAQGDSEVVHSARAPISAGAQSRTGVLCHSCV